MKLRIIVLASAIIAFVAFVPEQSSPAQSARPPDLSHIAGVWRGQMDGMPAISLVVTDESGQLSGAVLFYFHMRKTVNDPWTSTAGLPEPLLRMRLDGDTLRFDVSHRRAHPPSTLSDPPVSFRLTLTGPNHAELVNESEKGPGLLLERSDY